VGSLERWRERCDVGPDSTDDTAWAAKCVVWCDRPEQAVQRLELVGDQLFQYAGPRYGGLRLALTWLREEMAKDPDHA
jgi:hypothetical protein